ncbi:Endoribonuclease Dicer 3, partial [Orchesella cincta]
ILAMSTQILVDAITKGFVRWTQIALVILDECHHAQKNHPMASLMKGYAEKRESCPKDVPKVLGLTATIIIGKSKVADIPKEIKDIEKLLCCKAVTHRNYEEVLRHSTSTQFQIRTYETKYTENDQVCEDITGLLQLLAKLPKNVVTEDEISTIESIDHPSLISEDQLFSKRKGVPQMLKTFLNDLLKTYVELGAVLHKYSIHFERPYCAKLAAVVKMIFILQWIRQISSNSDSDSSDDDDDDYEIKEDEDPVDAVVLLENVLTVLNAFIRRIDNSMKAVALSQGSRSDQEAYIIKHCVSPKIGKLLELLGSKSMYGYVIDL